MKTVPAELTFVCGNAEKSESTLEVKGAELVHRKGSLLSVDAFDVEFDEEADEPEVEPPSIQNASPSAN